MIPLVPIERENWRFFFLPISVTYVIEREVTPPVQPVRSSAFWRSSGGVWSYFIVDSVPVAELGLRCCKPLFACHIRPSRVSNRVPGHTAVFAVDVGDITELMEKLTQRCRAVGIPVSREPQFIRVVVLIVGLSLVKLVVQHRHRAFLETSPPVLVVLRGLVLGNAEDVVVEIDP